jgi:hypothetical protein
MDSSFFADIRQYFAAQISAAGVEQTPAQQNRPKLWHTVLPIICL